MYRVEHGEGEDAFPSYASLDQNRGYRSLRKVHPLHEHKYQERPLGGVHVYKTHVDYKESPLNLDHELQLLRYTHKDVPLEYLFRKAYMPQHQREKDSPSVHVGK